MNIIEFLNQTTYSNEAEFRRDCSDLRYKQDATFREAVENKLVRSMPKLNIKPGHTSKQNAAVRATRDASGTMRFSHDVHALPPGHEATNSGNKFEVLAGGCVRYYVGTDSADQGKK